jgi:hypothetical protein
LGLVGLAVAGVLLATGALAKTLPLAAPAASPAREPAIAAPPAASSRSTTASPSRAVRAPTADVPAPSVTLPPRTASPTPTPTSTATPSPPRSYEAEAGELSGFVRIFQMQEASGGAVVGLIGMHNDSFVHFPEIAVEAPGEYELVLYYVSADAREAVLTVNNLEPVRLKFPELSNGREVGELRVPVELLAGRNELRFGNPDGRAPSLDRITVTG